MKRDTSVRWLALALAGLLAAAGCGDDDGGDSSGMPDAGGTGSDGGQSADAGGTGSDGGQSADAAPGDTTPPAAVLALTAQGSESGPPHVALAWQPPADPDLAGVVILRRTGGPVTDAPGDGVSLSEGDAVGDSVVAFVGAAEAAVDAVEVGGVRYRFAAFAFDAALNYGPPAHAEAMPRAYFQGLITVPPVGGPVVVAPALQSGSLTVSGTSVITKGGAVVTLQFSSNAERPLFNPKLMYEGATGDQVLVESSGAIDGTPFVYYGPRALAGGATTESAQWVFSRVLGGFAFDVSLREDPLLLVTRMESGLTLVDAGQPADVLNLPLDEATATWFSTLSLDATRVYVAHHLGNGVSVLDLTTDEIVGTYVAAPEPAPEPLPPVAPGGGAPGVTVELAGSALSPDGTRLYVVGSDRRAAVPAMGGAVPGGGGGGVPNALFLVELDVTQLPPVELRRASLGWQPAGAGNFGVARGLALDAETGRALVPRYGSGMVHVVEISSMTELDTDGDAGNGITPVMFDEAHLATKQVIISPDRSAAYVTFGQGRSRSSTRSNDVAEISMADMTAVTYLPLVADELAAPSSGSGAKFGPDGRLYVPRTRYPNAVDANSFGLSVFDLSETPVTERRVPALGSASTGNNDVWDVEFLPGGARGVLSMADADDLLFLDLATLQAIDIDGDDTNGHTNLETSAGSFYGADITVAY